MKTIYVAFDKDFLVDEWKYDLKSFKDILKEYQGTKDFSCLMRIEFDPTRYDVDYGIDGEFWITTQDTDEEVNPKNVTDGSLEIIYMDKEYYLGLN